VIANGKLVRGAHGFGAEIGHMRVDFEEETFCNCGKRGCLEQYCSANGIARQAKIALHNGSRESFLNKLKDITAKDVFDAAKAGDAFALEQVDHFGERMARALSYIACVTDPEMFVIGGGVSKAGPIVLDAIRRYYGENTYGRQQDVIFVIAGLGNDAGIYGSAKLLIE
jgi:glucokinase